MYRLMIIIILYLFFYCGLSAQSSGGLGKRTTLPGSFLKKIKDSAKINRNNLKELDQSEIDSLSKGGLSQPFKLSVRMGDPKDKRTRIIVVSPKLTFFTEPEDIILNADEVKKIKLVINNDGGIPAKNLTLKLVPDRNVSGIQYARYFYLSELSAKSQKNFDITFKTSDDVPDQKIRFQINMNEKRGYVSEPYSFIITTKKSPTSDLMLTGYKINDRPESRKDIMGNSDGKIELGETVEVIATIQNLGMGKARDVNAIVSLIDSDPNVKIRGKRNTIDLGDINPGRERNIEFLISTNRKYKKEKIGLNISFFEKKSILKKNEKVDLAINSSKFNLITSLPDALLFDFDKSVLKDGSSEVLDIVVNYLSENPTTVLEVAGHTDNKGTVQYNNKLSKDRASSVAAYIISKNINKERIVSKGYGKSKPVTSNKTEEGRQQNRRVEFTLVKD